jgi:hypothetical protein
MKNKFTAASMLAVCCSVLLLQCDTDKYFGYSYNADLPDNEVTISGKVINTFTEQMVSGAIVNINGQTTETDFQGEYLFTYTVAEDEGYSRPIPVIISKENYFPLHTSLIIYPTDDNILDARLIYAAPIIQESTFIDSICSAQIFDYQGVNDIDSVFTIHAYIDSDSGYAFLDTLPMPLVNILDANTGLFQTVVPDCVGTGQLAVTARYQILAIDKSGYRDIRMF